MHNRIRTQLTWEPRADVPASLESFMLAAAETLRLEVFRARRALCEANQRADSVLSKRDDSADRHVKLARKHKLEEELRTLEAELSERPQPSGFGTF
ncbi:MAG: hypothetical protein KBC96_13395 [Armatimonadetes bacterium]|nr:hypothetical protein [Armatimonadota bacterium]